MQLLRREFGIAEPVRRGMELSICQLGEWRPVALGGGSAGVHADILAGRDCEVQWEDVFTGKWSLWRVLIEMRHGLVASGWVIMLILFAR